MKESWLTDYLKNKLTLRFPQWNFEIFIFFLIFALGVIILYCYYKPKAKKALLWAITYFYSYNILIVVLFMREPIDENFDFTLLKIFEHDTALDFVFNIIMFLPLGILLMTFFKKHAFLKTISIGLISTVTIELVQGLSKLGTCELIDIISNFIGAVIGGLIYTLGVFICNKYKNNILKA